MFYATAQTIATVEGHDGPTGVTGSRGEVGSAGGSWIGGASGASGARRPAASGPAGPAGPAGVAGPKGDGGPVGPQGPGGCDSVRRARESVDAGAQGVQERPAPAACGLRRRPGSPRSGGTPVAPQGRSGQRGPGGPIGPPRTNGPPRCPPASVAGRIPRRPQHTVHPRTRRRCSRRSRQLQRGANAAWRRLYFVGSGQQPPSSHPPSPDRRAGALPCNTTAMTLMSAQVRVVTCAVRRKLPAPSSQLPVWSSLADGARLGPPSRQATSTRQRELKQEAEVEAGSRKREPPAD